jgi:hypothetical protein
MTQGEEFQIINVKKEKTVYNKQKIKVLFHINTGFIFILLYENDHISVLATVTHVIFNLIPRDGTKSCIYRKKNINILYIIPQT